MVLERQSGILSKVLPRLVGVVHDLGGEGLEGGELPLLPQVLVKLHLDLLAVEVAVEIQDEALDGQLVAVVDGGAGAHVGHGQVGVAVFQDDLGGIDALGGGENVLLQLQVHRGEAQGGAQLLVVGHPVAEGVGMAQKFVGAFDLPLGD